VPTTDASNFIGQSPPLFRSLLKRIGRTLIEGNYFVATASLRINRRATIHWRDGVLALLGPVRVWAETMYAKRWDTNAMGYCSRFTLLPPRRRICRLRMAS